MKRISDVFGFFFREELFLVSEVQNLNLLHLHYKLVVIQ